MPKPEPRQAGLAVAATDEGEVKGTSAGRLGRKATTRSPCTSHLLSPDKAASLLLPGSPSLGWPWLCHSLLPSCQDLASSALAPPPAVYTAEKPGAASQQVNRGQHHPSSSAQARSKSCLADRPLPWKEAQRTQQSRQDSKAQLSPAFLRLPK